MTASITAMPKYKSYKDSGVEWIGQTPESWEIKKLKYLFYEKKHLSNILLSCGAISFGEVVKKDDNNVSEFTKRSYQEILTDEFLLNPLNLNYDLKSFRIALSKINVVVSSGYIVLKEKSNIDKQYFKYLLHRFDVADLKLMGSGVRQTINYGHIANSLLPFPLRKEQQAIANFLDKKTTLIDKAMQIKEKQIALLKEYKQIIIQNAVTKGLNPNAPMKDSGVEWIGEIPEHWEVKKFYNIFKISKGLTITKEDLSDNGIPCVNYGEIHSKYGFEVCASKNTLKCVDEKYIKISPNALLKQGDFIFADTSEDLEGSGNFTHVSGVNNIFAGYHTITARPYAEVNSRFLAYLFSSQGHRNQIRQKVKGVKVYSITQAILKKLKSIFPTTREQQAIANFLDKKTALIDKAIKAHQIQINKLKEYKASLIDSAVTGKIKVI